MNIRSLTKTLAFSVALAAVWLSATGLLAYQNPVPTLVPPTLVPVMLPPPAEIIPTESAVARIQRDSRVRVGVLYNEPPFGILNIRGDISGFDADLARKLAETWGVELQLVQVTRQTWQEMLNSDQVDLVLAARVHSRELDTEVEFSQTYYPGKQMMMVREGDGATLLGHMEGRKVGVVVGTRGETAVRQWLERSGLNVTVTSYFTLDQAAAGLLANEVDGIVETEIKLARLFTEPGIARFVDEQVSPDPLAVVMRRQDVNLRNLVNRTLQYLLVEGALNTIHQANFADAPYPADAFSIWQNIGDEAPTPGQFGTDVPVPASNIVPRIQSSQVVRVAGVMEVTPETDPGAAALDAFNRTVIEAMAARWGVRVEYIPNSSTNALDLVANGQADLAVGVQPDWVWADRVDFTDPYLLHGRRLLVRVNSDINDIRGLRSDTVAVYEAESGAAEEIEALAEAQNVRINTFLITQPERALEGMLVDDNYHAIYGDSLRLIPIVKANSDEVRLTVNDNGGWFTRNYMVFALPRNDIDFRLLVNYTLQELALDNTLAALSQPVVMPDEPLTYDVWPGSSFFLGYDLATEGGAQTLGG